LSNSSPLSSSAKADDPVFQRRLSLSSEAAGHWMPAFAGMTVDLVKICESAFSRRSASELCVTFHPPRYQRAQGKPGAGRTRGPRATKSTGVGPQVNRSNTGFPCTMVYGLLRALPGDRAFLPPSSAAALAARELSASVGAPEPHDFAVRVTCARQSHAPRPPHLTATFVTIATRPSSTVRRAELNH
jgi:hypothetical protein